LQEREELLLGMWSGEGREPKAEEVINNAAFAAHHQLKSGEHTHKPESPRSDLMPLPPHPIFL